MGDAYLLLGFTAMNPALKIGLKPGHPFLIRKWRKAGFYLVAQLSAGRSEPHRSKSLQCLLRAEAYNEVFALSGECPSHWTIEYSVGVALSVLSVDVVLLRTYT